MATTKTSPTMLRALAHAAAGKVNHRPYRAKDATGGSWCVLTARNTVASVQSNTARVLIERGLAEVTIDTVHGFEGFGRYTRPCSCVNQHLTITAKGRETLADAS